MISKLTGRTAKEEALAEFREKLSDAVAEAYPSLLSAASAYNERKRMAALDSEIGW